MSPPSPVGSSSSIALDLARPRSRRSARIGRHSTPRRTSRSAPHAVPPASAEVEERVDDVGEVVPTEEEPGGRRSAQTSGQRRGARCAARSGRLPPVVRLPLQTDRPPLDLGRARAARTAGRTAPPPSRRRSPGARDRSPRRSSRSRAKDRIVSSSRYRRPVAVGSATTMLRWHERLEGPSDHARAPSPSRRPCDRRHRARSRSRTSPASRTAAAPSVLQQAVRPLDGGPKGAVALVVAPSDRAPERRTAVERVEDTLHTERRSPSRGQLDRERQPVQAGAEVLDVGAARHG